MDGKIDTQTDRRMDEWWDGKREGREKFMVS